MGTTVATTVTQMVAKAVKGGHRCIMVGADRRRGFHRRWGPLGDGAVTVGGMIAASTVPVVAGH
jgi:hypothetical protein